MNIRPILDQILVRRDPEDARTPGGLHIPEAHQGHRKMPRGRGVVLAVGPGRRKTVPGVAGARRPAQGHDPMDVAVGDRVIFSKLSGDKVADSFPLIDDDLVLIREAEVLAVLEDAEDDT